MFRVHIGYTAAGRDRWRYFATIDLARAFCARVFQRARLVLTIEAKP